MSSPAGDACTSCLFQEPLLFRLLLPLLLLLLLLLMSTHDAVAGLVSCEVRRQWTPDSSVSGVEFSDGVLLSFTTDRPLFCSFACSSAPTCCTFSYNELTRKCTLYTRSFGSDDLPSSQASPETKVYSVKGGCCVPEPILRATPIFSAEATPNSPLHLAGTALNYTCKLHFSYFGPTRLCQENTTWSEGPGVCSRTSWTEITLSSFGGRFPDTVRPGVQIIVTAIFGLKLFEFQLRYSNRHSPFFLSARLQDKGDVRTTRVFTLTDTQTEMAVSSNFPFEANQPFNLTITIRDTYAELSVSGDPWENFSFDVNMPVSEVKTMFISGDCDLERVDVVYP